MDLIFISKIIIIVLLYIIVDQVYKKTNWHTKGIKTNITLQYFLTIIFGLPFLYSVVAFGFIVLFEGGLNFLDSKSYIEQVILIFGLIICYFVVKVKADSERFKQKEKDAIIEELRKEIQNFENR